MGSGSSPSLCLQFASKYSCALRGEGELLPAVCPRLLLASAPGGAGPGRGVARVAPFPSRIPHTPCLAGEGQ